MLHSEPIPEPAVHGRLMELNACDSTTHTACSIISPNTLNPHLFSCPPILVSPGSDWWSSAMPLEKNKKERRKVCFNTRSLGPLNMTGLFMYQYKEWKTGKLLQPVRSRSLMAPVKCSMEFHSTRRRYSLLKNYLEFVNSFSLFSITVWVCKKP